MVRDHRRSPALDQEALVRLGGVAWLLRYRPVTHRYHDDDEATRRRRLAAPLPRTPLTPFCSAWQAAQSPAAPRPGSTIRPRALPELVGRGGGRGGRSRVSRHALRARSIISSLISAPASRSGSGSTTARGVRVGTATPRAGSASTSTATHRQRLSENRRFVAVPLRREPAAGIRARRRLHLRAPRSRSDFERQSGVVVTGSTLTPRRCTVGRPASRRCTTKTTRVRHLASRAPRTPWYAKVMAAVRGSTPRA